MIVPCEQISEAISQRFLLETKAFATHVMRHPLLPLTPVISVACIARSVQRRPTVVGELRINENVQRNTLVVSLNMTAKDSLRLDAPHSPCINQCILPQYHWLTNTLHGLRRNGPIQLYTRQQRNVLRTVPICDPGMIAYTVLRKDRWRRPRGLCTYVISGQPIRSPHDILQISGMSPL